MTKKVTPGPDGITVEIMGGIFDYHGGVLLDLINRSILAGYFPRELRIARVIPVFKKGDKNDRGNYRPISLLNIFSKVIERVF